MSFVLLLCWRSWPKWWNLYSLKDSSKTIINYKLHGNVHKNIKTVCRLNIGLIKHLLKAKSKTIRNVIF